MLEYSFEKIDANGSPGLKEWSGRWHLKGKFPSPFGEPFHVAASEGEYFFVTDSGTVYMAEETNGKWQTAAVWKDAARPVLAMLVDSDGATAFVFGKDFYFKVAKKAQADALPRHDAGQGRFNRTCADGL